MATCPRRFFWVPRHPTVYWEHCLNPYFKESSNMMVPGFICPSASARLIFINKLQSPFCLHHEQFWKINSKYFASTSSAPTFNKIPFWYVIVIVVSHHCVIISMTDAPSCTHGFPSPLNQFSLIKHFSENLGGVSFYWYGLQFTKCPTVAC